MKTIEGKVLSTNGLTARLSALIVNEANKYKSTCKIYVIDEQADLKSIMNVMALVVPRGLDFTIQIEGEDEEQAEIAFNKLLKELELKN